MRDGAAGKNVAALVEEQLQYCRSLRLANMLSVTQNVATNEECLKQANSLIMILKADVRALNSCAVRLLAPSEAGSESETSVPSEVARSAYNVETVERLFRRFRQVETGDSTGASAIRAVSSTNQLVTMKARLQAGLGARLLELKAEMDKEFGMAFVDMESYLRTEKDTQAKSDAEHCSACARSFVELCYKFQVMVHACRGLRAAKEGLSQTVLLKALREERDALAQRLGDAETDLKKIHHNYTEIMTPEVVVGLENRQRHKIGEQEADLARLKTEIASLRRDHERLLAENGRFSDAVGELQSQLHSSKEQYGRELAWLNPRVVLAESRGVEIEGLVDQMNLRLSLLGTSQKKAAEEIHDLKGESSRKERLVLVAMMARAEAHKAYGQVKQESVALEQRLRATEAARTTTVLDKEDVERRLKAAEGMLEEAEARGTNTSEELRKVQEDLRVSKEEGEILEQRLRDQEMELRDFSNLQGELATLKVIKTDLVSRLATVGGHLEDLKQKAIGIGMGKQLGLF